MKEVVHLDLSMSGSRLLMEDECVDVEMFIKNSGEKFYTVEELMAIIEAESREEPVKSPQYDKEVLKQHLTYHYMSVKDMYKNLHYENEPLFDPIRFVTMGKFKRTEDGFRFHDRNNPGISFPVDLTTCLIYPTDGLLASIYGYFTNRNSVGCFVVNVWREMRLDRLISLESFMAGVSKQANSA